ncbi:hypothetical protein [Flavonifractor sp. An306]|uniref:hypothetical protein n=1 Tax=Flavonifractor sp. An306 TaxID=1965629 RepID=UPI000B3AF346|nr:hypothetical protein [Flavonifractor sp. An306]OUO37602.1 hypothetical protein B5F88_12485 [Flavonifractor sp. An306]
MQIGGLGISEAAKWGETPKIQRAANKAAQNAMTDGFVEQIKEMAKKDAEKGVYMSDEFGQMRLAQMRKHVSPNRSKPVAQAAAYIQKASNRYGTLLARLLGGYSMKAYVGGLHPTAEVYAPNGEMIAAYTTAGTWKEIPTAAEEKFMSEAASVYLEAFRAARAEMKSASQATAGGSEAGIDLRA